MGLEYRYRHPSCLLVQVERPGRMRIYQGAYHIAMLADGAIQDTGIELNLSLHRCARAGLRKLDEYLIPPEVEFPRETDSFEFIALCNTFVGMANSIRDRGHGGTVVVVPTVEHPQLSLFRIKYRQQSFVLRDAFVRFMNARHKIADIIARQENQEVVSKEQVLQAELDGRDAYSDLVEATRFVAYLAGCDGAVVVSEDLCLLGFGAEIRAELREGVKVIEPSDPIGRKGKELDVEQFGMRHRSAVKLVSQEPQYCVLVVSQDGPISTVWSDAGRVLVNRGVNLVNLNMPWA